MNAIERQREARCLDPDHPSNKFPDPLLEESIERAISNCNKRVSVLDVMVEATGGICLYGVKYQKLLSRRERQYLAFRIGKMLSERYKRESEKVWLVREGVEA